MFFRHIQRHYSRINQFKDKQFFVLNIAVHFKTQTDIIKIVMQFLSIDINVNIDFRGFGQFAENLRRMRNFQGQVLNILGINHNRRLRIIFVSGLFLLFFTHFKHPLCYNNG